MLRRSLFDPLFRRAKLDEQMAEEFRFHLECRATDLVRGGMAEDEAYRQARIEFGARNTYAEQIRQSRRAAWFHDIGRDLQFAARTLRKAPGFTAIVIVTLGVAIASNTAVFTVVNALLLKQLPYPHPERLVNVWRTHGHNWTGSVSAPDLRDWQERNSVFEGMSAFANRRLNLRTGTSEPQAVEAARVSANLFQVMGVAPRLGRGFTPEEETLGRDHVVVLGYELWSSAFGSDPHILGQTIDLNGDTYTVIGVTTPGFHYPLQLTSVWVPLAPAGEELSREVHDFQCVGRLKPGVTVEQATAQLNAISASMAKDHPEDAGLGSWLIPLKKAAVGGIENGLLYAFAVVGVIFFIACANVATFLLSRAASRQREIAVRLALGASTGRIMRQFLIEGLMLALIAAVIAFFVSRALVTAILAVGHAYFSMAGPVHQDYRVMLFTVALAVGAAVGIALAAAWSATHITVGDALKEHAATVAGGRHRIRAQRFLVAAQVASAFVLLICTGTLVQTFIRLSRINPGFDPHNVLTMRIPISTGKYSAQHPLSLLMEPTLARIRALPGVKAAGVITVLPMQGWGTNTNIRFTKEEQHGEGQQPWAETRAVSAGYCQALGIQLLRGRALTESDGEQGHVAAVVNETFVRRYSPDQEIVGRQVFLTDGGAVTVVGVMADSRQAGRDSEPRPEIDLPYTETIWPYLTETMSLVVKTQGDPLAYTGPVRQAIYSVDSSQGIYGVETMEQIIADVEGDRRFAMWLLATFSIVALVLVASGLFALLSYSVAERTHEIGVRLALGARASDILRMIVGQGGAITVVGVVAGLAASLAIVKLMQSLIFRLSPANLPVFIGAAIPVFAIAVVASYVPARRAASVDPMIALRSE